MKLLVLMFSMLSLTATGSIAQVQTVPDPRLPMFAYDPGRVFALRGAVNHHITIVFAPGESIDTVALGDSDGWQATPTSRGDSLVLKPLRMGQPSNMTVITDRRVYNFGLSTGSAPAPDTPFMVRFDYANELSIEPSSPQHAGIWRLSGAGDARPSEIMDDGERIYISWRADQPIPAIFSVDQRGAETLLEAQMRNGRLVLDHIHDRLVFRIDNRAARATRRTAGARR